jgi:hypothetical protein
MPRTDRLIALPLLAVSALALTGCDWFNSQTSSDTQMKNVEILPGTASDEMITLDQASGDGTAIDTSTAVGPAPPRPAAADAADEGGDSSNNGDTPATDDSEEGRGSPRDTVIRPPAGGAEQDK